LDGGQVVLDVISAEKGRGDIPLAQGKIGGLLRYYLLLDLEGMKGRRRGWGVGRCSSEGWLL